MSFYDQTHQPNAYDKLTCRKWIAGCCNGKQNNLIIEPEARNAISFSHCIGISAPPTEALQTSPWSHDTPRPASSMDVLLSVVSPVRCYWTLWSDAATTVCLLCSSLLFWFFLLIPPCVPLWKSLAVTHILAFRCSAARWYAPRWWQRCKYCSKTGCNWTSIEVEGSHLITIAQSKPQEKRNNVKH